MKRAIQVLSLAILPCASFTVLADREFATCYGNTPCHACKNCKYCKHCAKDGGTCGVCKRGVIAKN